MANFQIATWYDTWNATGLQNLVDKKVPLNYATRYNLAFGELAEIGTGGYSVHMTGKYADQVKSQILSQTNNGVEIYAGLGSTGIVDAVNDNKNNNNRSSVNIADWLSTNGYKGISIDAEDLTVMKQVPTLIEQLSSEFDKKGLGIAVSVPWPGNGPEYLYGKGAVNIFNKYVQYLEFQDYSSSGTPNDVSPWTSKGIEKSIIMGGVSTENGIYQTSLANTESWTLYALQNELGGMFSWRLDNDHGQDGQQEDVDPTFTGAKKIYDTVQAYFKK
ncbi:hypothetical protein [Pseudotenacibaculum haliotis]|uniref:GH18 domain-containing protein n=1 Tax=Pseudotenacibaculum haliotis TaxID=1862138 RepID=A0ABW5LWS9_9FLAO